MKALGYISFKFCFLFALGLVDKRVEFSMLLIRNRWGFSGFLGDAVRGVEDRKLCI